MIRILPLSLLIGFALLTQVDSSLMAEPVQSALPADIQNDLGFFVGEWRAEGDVLGMGLTGRWIAKWAPARHCLLITYPLILDGQEITGHGVMGWDSAAKELLIQMFYSDGTMETARYKRESPGLFKGSFVGSANGESSKAACEVRTQQPNEWTFKTIGRTGGKIPGELSVRFIRSEIKPKKKPAK